MVGKACHRSSVGDRDASVNDYFRVNAFIPALDHILQDVELRFGKHMKLVAGLSTMVPKRVLANDADWELLQPAYKRFQTVLGSVTESQLMLSCVCG